MGPIVLPMLLAIVSVSLMLFAPPAAAENPPSPEEYVDYVGGDARILPAGGLKLDGAKQLCGRRPTVLDPNLDDYGAAYPGFLIMNPKLLARVSTPVKKWIYAHECGHQFRGPDEETADCFAVPARTPLWLVDSARPRRSLQLYIPCQGRHDAPPRFLSLRIYAQVLRRSYGSLTRLLRRLLTAANPPAPPKPEYAGPLNSGLPGDCRSICAGSNWQKNLGVGRCRVPLVGATYPNWSRSVRRGSPVTPKRSPILGPVAADALSQIYGHSANPATGFKARDRTAIREFSCIHGYVTSIVEVL